MGRREREIRKFVSWFCEPRWNSNQEYLEHYLSLGDEVVPYLAKAYGWRRADIRMKLVEALGKIGTKNAMETVVEAMKGDKELKVRLKALEIVAERGEDAIQVLNGMLEDSEVGIKLKALEIVAERGEDAIPVLKGMLKDDDAWIRCEVVGALGGIGSDKAMEAVKGMYRDENINVRAEVVGQIGDNFFKQGLMIVLHAARDPDEEMSELGVDAVQKLGRYCVIPMANTMLHSEKPNVWEYGVSFFEILLDPENKGRKWAVEQMRNEKVIGALFEVLWTMKERQYNEMGGQVEKMWTMADRIGRVFDGFVDGSCLPALLDQLKKRKMRKMKGEILEVVAKTGDVETIMELLQDWDTETVVSAAKTLGMMRNERAVDELILTMQKDKDARAVEAATKALGEIGGRKVINEVMGEIRRSAEDHTHLSNIPNLYNAIGKAGGKRELRGILKFILNKGHQKFAIDAIKNIASREYVPVEKKRWREDVMKLMEFLGEDEHNAWAGEALKSIAESGATEGELYEEKKMQRKAHELKSLGRNPPGKIMINLISFPAPKPRQKVKTQVGEKGGSRVGGMVRINLLPFAQGRRTG